MNRPARRDVLAAAAWLPTLTYELAELRRGDLGMPYTRYVRLLPRWVRKALLIVAFIVAWHPLRRPLGVTVNPLALFTDLIPAKVRLWIYATAALLLFGYSLWLAVEGDWLQFAVALVTALGSSMAGGNVNTEPDFTDYTEYEGE